MVAFERHFVVGTKTETRLRQIGGVPHHDYPALLPCPYRLFASRDRAIYPGRVTAYGSI